MSIKKSADKLIGKTVNAVTSAVSQTSSTAGHDKKEPDERIVEICRKAAAEGMVLLRNDDNFFPIKKDETVSVFGRIQNDPFYVGYGSGGDVNAYHKISFSEAINDDPDLTINKSLASVYRKWCKKNRPDDGYWGHWPMSYEEMPLTSEIVSEAAEKSDKALVFIGRAAGEDRENTLTKGSFYLTDEEENMLSLISSCFTKFAVILNIGGIFDFSWCEKYSVPSILITWLGGMETGNAFADVISGRTSPCGCLPDSIARYYGDYPSSASFGDKDSNTYKEDIYVGYRYFETFSPENVLFHFGSGSSYTDFNVRCASFERNGTRTELKISVENTGNRNGKKIVQIYCEAPQGKLGKPMRTLCAFDKTRELAPGETEILDFSIDDRSFASYDDAGYTGNKSCYVLEEGSYKFYTGDSSADVCEAGNFTVKQTIVIDKLREISSVKEENRFMRIKAYFSAGKFRKTYELVPARSYDLKSRIENDLPEGMPPSVGNNYTLDDVMDGTITLSRFVSELTYDELEALSRGDYIMNSPLGPKGNAGVFGGVTESLRKKGVRPAVCCDGPSGIRLATQSALIPCGTSLAASWNTGLIEELYGCIAKEMEERGVHVLLAPGMNIHRNPLCGRNFEYFSEDPLLTGHIASAVVKGIQSTGLSACPKHFACNNQETNRVHNDSVLSERALREIYLKGFEICVKKSSPKNLMTSYNKINGVWGHYNYDLVTSVLREEWGFQGNVITDWWMRSCVSPEFPSVRNQGYRVRAGVDVLMPGGSRTGKKEPDGTLLESLGKDGGITTGELQRTATHVISFILTLPHNEEDNVCES